MSALGLASKGFTLATKLGLIPKMADTQASRFLTKASQATALFNMGLSLGLAAAAIAEPYADSAVLGFAQWNAEGLNPDGTAKIGFNSGSLSGQDQVGTILEVDPKALQEMAFQHHLASEKWNQASRYTPTASFGPSANEI